MLKNDYFESIIFEAGNQFNVSRTVGVEYINRIHWHPFVEILVSLSPDNHASVNFTRYTLGINDLLLIYPGDLHSIEACQENSYLVIQFPNELLSIMGELRNHLSLFSRFPCIRYHPGQTASDQLILLLNQFAQLSETEVAYKEVEMYALLLHFFALVGRYCDKAQLEAPVEASSSEHTMLKQMAEACLYLSLNCTKPLTLEDVAAHIGISKSYFANLFKKYTNSTFIDFLTGERIKRALALFRNKDTRIIDIAFESGFTSLSSFNRAFKKTTGMTPSKFRERMTRDTV